MWEEESTGIGLQQSIINIQAVRPHFLSVHLSFNELTFHSLTNRTEHACCELSPVVSPHGSVVVTVYKFVRTPGLIFHVKPLLPHTD